MVERRRMRRRGGWSAQAVGEWSLTARLTNREGTVRENMLCHNTQRFDDSSDSCYREA